MKILVLNEANIKEVFTMKDAIQADKDALEYYSKGESETPLRINIDVAKHQGQSLYMPGYVEGASALGVKVVSTYPNNIKKALNSVPAVMVLVDAETGQVSCLMDGTYLTRIRTGAVSGGATDLLARKDSKVFTLIGTGGQAESQLEAVLSVRPIEKVNIVDLSKERAQEFIDKMTKAFEGIYDIDYNIPESLEEAIREADIITTVTTSKRPTFEGKWVKPGTHINAVGSYTPDMQETDAYVLTDLADKIYVDTRDGVLNESGDFIIPIKQGIFKESMITGELGEVILNKVASRESESEVTYFNTTGSAVLDVVTGQRIYEKALEKNIGSFIEL